MIHIQFAKDVILGRQRGRWNVVQEKQKLHWNLRKIQQSFKMSKYTKACPLLSKCCAGNACWKIWALLYCLLAFGTANRYKRQILLLAISAIRMSVNLKQTVLMKLEFQEAKWKDAGKWNSATKGEMLDYKWALPLVSLLNWCAGLEKENNEYLLTPGCLSGEYPSLQMLVLCEYFLCFYKVLMSSLGESETLCFFTLCSRPLNFMGSGLKKG